jgi:hydrogenase-4 component F
MGLTLPDIAVLALPFASAALLACIASWRTGVWISTASSTLVFAVACLLPWQFRTAVQVHLALLTAFIGMTTSWFGWRDLRAALAAWQLDRRSARWHHVGCQALTGAVLLALLSDSPAVTWLGTTIAVAAAAGLTAAVRNRAAQRAAARLILMCGAGLMLALFGTLLLYGAAQADAVPLRWRMSQLAIICLILGYGGTAGVVPLHSWLPDAVAEGSTQGATLIGALLVNVPLLAILRLRSATTDEPDASLALLVAVGLATLLIAAFCLTARLDTRRRLAFAGTAQVGIVVFAFGLGSRAATFGGLLLMTMLALARAAALQCPGAASTRAAVLTRTASDVVLAGLPIVALFLIAGATAERAPWLLLPLAIGALLTTGSLIGGPPTPGIARDGCSPAAVLALAPVWLQLALVVLLAVAMPGPVAGWFRTMAALR